MTPPLELKRYGSTFEEIRSEVLELDRESQGKLVEEIEQQWTSDIDEAGFMEAARRMEAYRRGEGTTVSAEESISRVRRMIEDYRKSHHCTAKFKRLPSAIQNGRKV